MPQSRSRFLISHAAICSVAFSLCCASLTAQQTRDLAEDSPFLPPNYKLQLQKKLEEEKKPPPPPPKPPPLIEKNLEFKGCMRLRNVWKFCIFDKRSGKSSWVKLNSKADAGFTVIEFDVENKTVVIEENGHKESISLKSPSGNPVPIAHLKAAPKPTPKPTQKKPGQPASSKKTPTDPIPRRRIVTPSKN